MAARRLLKQKITSIPTVANQCWETSAFCAKWAGAAWGSFTNRSRFLSAAASLLRSSPRPRCTTRGLCSGAEQSAQVADALHHAHELGVTHRDIKPANLMLDRLGHIWITDFGLARIEGEGNLTMTGDLVGTLRYMSPEQSLAKRIGIDHR